MWWSRLLKTVNGACFSVVSGGCSGQSAYSKMFQTFEERVFGSLSKKCISSVDYDSKASTAINNNHERSSSRAQYDKISVTDDAKAYEEAVKTLNTLQSNAESLRHSITGQNPNSLEDTRKYLLRSGLSLEDLDKLSFIHVSGTKGKGTTCALTESILRTYGVKTGFYSSPHLVAVTERIRINGQPITKQKFTQFFWRVFRKLQAAQEHDNDMPAYFKFLTILCFHIYLEERVDVVVLEVGIGGELDCTNVIRNTKTVGITSLGLEHTQLLGNSLREIAWQKAGIIKPGSNVFTSVTQPECLAVIRERAREKQANVYIVPDFKRYFQNPKAKELLEHSNNVTQLNGSLATQLAYDWLRHQKNGLRRDYAINSTHLAEQALMGLVNCNWPGRCQLVKFFNFNIHLDGAHTVESMCVCRDWFARVSSKTENPKVLIFNATGDRDSKKLLGILRQSIHFDTAYFVPNIAITNVANRNDNQSKLYSNAEQLRRARLHAANWSLLCSESHEVPHSHILPSILDSFYHMQCLYGSSRELDVLITGSIYLIGASVLALNELSRELVET